MHRVSVAEARQKLRTLLDEVESGQEVVVLRRGKEVARIVPVSPRAKGRRLPALAGLRASIKVKGAPLSGTVLSGRRAERY